MSERTREDFLHGSSDAQKWGKKGYAPIGEELDRKVFDSDSPALNPEEILLAKEAGTLPEGLMEENLSEGSDGAEMADNVPDYLTAMAKRREEETRAGWSPKRSEKNKQLSPNTAVLAEEVHEKHALQVLQEKIKSPWDNGEPERKRKKEVPDLPKSRRKGKIDTKPAKISERLAA